MTDTMDFLKTSPQAVALRAAVATWNSFLAHVRKPEVRTEERAEWDQRNKEMMRLASHARQEYARSISVQDLTIVILHLFGNLPDADSQHMMDFGRIRDRIDADYLAERHGEINNAIKGKVRMALDALVDTGTLTMLRAGDAPGGWRYGTARHHWVWQTPAWVADRRLAIEQANSEAQIRKSRQVELVEEFRISGMAVKATKTGIEMDIDTAAALLLRIDQLMGTAE